MFKSIKVKDYMTASLTIFSPAMDVMAAVNRLIGKSISGAPVVDDHGNLVGMLSERDCIRVALETGYYSKQAGVVSDYMQTDVQTIDSNMSVVELAQLFIDKPFRRYPVVEDGRLVGQISIRDVLRAMENISPPEAS